MVAESDDILAIDDLTEFFLLKNHPEHATRSDSIDANTRDGA